MKRRHLLAACGTGLVAWSRHGLAANAPAGPDIVLGQTGVLSGPLGQQIQIFNRGAQLVFDQANAQGGIQGRPIRLVSLDDELKPERAVANCRTLLDEHKAVALFGCVGSGTTAATSAVLAQTGVPAFGGYAVSDSARDKTRGQAYFVRAGYAREAEALLQLLGTIGVQRVAVAHLANPGGQEVLGIFKQVLAERKMSLTGAAAVAGDGANVAESAKAVVAGDTQAVVMFLGAPLAAGLMQAVWDGGARPSFYGMSIVAGDTVAQKLGDRTRGLAIAQAVPFPWGEVDPDLRTYHRLSQQAKVPVSYYSFEGFLNASLQVEVLRRARDLGSASLHAAARSLKTRIAGMEVDFTRGHHTGSRFVELVQVTRDGRFVR